MGVELSGESDLRRRIDARRALAGTERARLRCKRCRKRIPPDRRRDAVYCSERCHNNHRWEQVIPLRTEVRRAVRMTAPADCQGCGVALDNRPGKPGPIGRKCKRCRDRESQRRHYRRPAPQTRSDNA